MTFRRCEGLSVRYTSTVKHTNSNLITKSVYANGSNTAAYTKLKYFIYKKEYFSTVNASIIKFILGQVYLTELNSVSNVLSILLP